MASDKRAALEELLKTNSISHEVTEHPAVFTVEEHHVFMKDGKGAHCKNLFLKDKKKNLYLLSCLADATVQLKDIAKLISAPGGLRFAEESLLTEKLGVTQGAVTALALYHDTEASVRFICDQRLLDDTHEFVNFHPMVNTATLTLSTQDFRKFLKITNHEPTPVVLTSPQADS